MIDAVADCLAVFRLTRLATIDTFPPVQNARFKILQRYDEKSWQAELGTCPWCLSIWIAFGVWILRRSRVWRPFRFVLATSAVAGVLSEHT